jgi:hypothetical protein
MDIAIAFPVDKPPLNEPPLDGCAKVFIHSIPSIGDGGADAEMII